MKLKIPKGKQTPGDLKDWITQDLKKELDGVRECRSKGGFHQIEYERDIYAELARREQALKEHGIGEEK